MKPKRYYLETFGCQMNVRDSEKMAGILEREGYERTENPQHADLIVFNTCSIREKAEQKFYSRLGRIKTIKKHQPSLKIVIAGCIAQQDGKAVFQRTPYIDYILGPQNIHRLTDIAQGTMSIPYALEENPYLTQSNLPSYRNRGVTAWVNIMYGCNNYCSYCVVPFTRGREQSRPSHDIIQEIKELEERNYKEITLLGQNVNSYMSDCTFAELLYRISERTSIDRIRFVTSHPKDLGDDLIYAMRDLPKVCEHLHLPLQSGSSRLLSLMRRKYTFEEYYEKVRKIRENIPTIAITSDIIVGFPQETEQDHQETLSALKTIGFDGLFAFKYSSRPHTHAATLDGHLDDNTKSRRLNDVITLQNSITDRINKKLKGSVQQVLIETYQTDSRNQQIFIGRTRTHKIVNILDRDDLKPGMLISVRIVKTARHSLTGEVIEK
jgi:tRNA-2-methylthio-N6-dimethylallyladenosine synthase